MNRKQFLASIAAIIAAPMVIGKSVEEQDEIYFGLVRSKEGYDADAISVNGETRTIRKTVTVKQAFRSGGDVLVFPVSKDCGYMMNGDYVVLNSPDSPDGFGGLIACRVIDVRSSGSFVLRKCNGERWYNLPKTGSLIGHTKSSFHV